MIGVETLMRQVIPKIIPPHGPGSRVEKGPHRRSRGLKRAVMALRSRSFPWFDEEE